MSNMIENDTDLIFKFFADNGFIDKALSIERLSVELNVEDIPKITVTYLAQKDKYTKEKSQ